MEATKQIFFGIDIEKIEASVIQVGDNIRADGRWVEVSKIEQAKFKSGELGLKISFKKEGSLKYKLTQIIIKVK